MKKANLLQCSNIGMVRDKDVAVLSGEQLEFAYNNHNIRITADLDNTLLAVTNEKGTLNLNLNIEGTFLGYCKLNEYIVLFTKSNTSDYIYRINKTNTEYSSDCLYSGDLEFDLDYPIEAIGYYESNDVLKVYWVDGKNPNRFINIADDKNGNAPNYSSGSKYQFDFQGHITNIPSVTITKDYSLAGTFASGTIQYAITLYNKYGLETGIIYLSDIQYLSKLDRGAKPEETVLCGFKLEITNVDKDYNHLRVYSIERASLNGTPISRIVKDVEVDTSTLAIEIIDLGTQGILYNANDLVFVGGQDLRASTLDAKLDTLFLGNVTLNEAGAVPQTIRAAFEDNKDTAEKEGISYLYPIGLSWHYKEIADYDTSSLYNHEQQINKSQEDIAGFKYREFYRFAIQFLLPNTEWTTPLWIGDSYCELAPKVENNKYCIANVNYTLPAGVGFSNYIAYRLLVAEMSDSDRRVLAQGVVCPTMYNFANRVYNRPYAINSWIFRPRMSNNPNRHFDTLPEQISPYAELQGVNTRKVPGVNTTSNTTKPNAYTLYLLPDAGHKVGYKMILFNNQNTFKTLDGREFSSEELIYKKNEQGVNEVAELKYSNIFAIIDGFINTTNWDNTKAELIKDINDKLNKLALQNETTYLNLAFTESMIPDNDVLKAMATETLGKSNPGLIGEIVAGCVVTALGIVFSILCGPAAPAIGWGDAAIWCLVGSTLSALAAVVGTTTIVDAVELMKNWPDADKQAARWGFLPLTNMTHSLTARRHYQALMTSSQMSLFDISNLPEYYVYSDNNGGIQCVNSFTKLRAEGIRVVDPHSTGNIENITQENIDDFPIMDHESRLGFYLYAGIPTGKEDGTSGLGSECNLYIQTGTFNNKSIYEMEADDRTNAYYIDESVITFNSPDITNVGDIINESSAVNFDLIGYIPVHNTYGTYEAITSTPGVSAYADVIPNRNKLGFNEADALTNAALYLDIKINLAPHPTDPLKYNNVIEPTNLSSLYKIFLWNRETSLSCYINTNYGIKNPFYIGKDSSDIELISYIPAKPLKKVFANIRVSNQTEYYPKTEDTIKVLDIHTLDIENPIYFNSESQTLSLFKSNNKNRTYYGNVNEIATIPNGDGYVLLNKDNALMWTPKNTITDTIADPIHIQYKSTPHIVIPLTWNTETGSLILPYSLNEEEIDLSRMYSKYSNEYVIEGENNNKTLYTANLLDCTDLPKFRPNTTTKPLEFKLILGEVSSDDLFNTVFLGWYEKCFKPNEPTDTSILNNYQLFKIYIEDLIDKTKFDTIIIPIKHKVDIAGGTSFTHILYTFIYKENNKIWYESISATEDASYIDYGKIKLSNRGSITTIGRRYIVGSTTNQFYMLSDSDLIGTYIESPDLEFDKVINFKNTLVTQTKLSWDINTPYLFLGEFTKKNYSLNTDLFTLELLKWIPCSLATTLDAPILKSWGDTYYQRWDCLKTYPTSQQEPNGVVDILSFMVESHSNLDGRCDVNRGTSNILTATPSNFNIANTAYDLLNNFFEYNILDDDLLNRNTFTNQIVWSLTKVLNEQIDAWTNISGVNFMNLNGSCGALNKIINVSDTLLAFLDSGLSIINYNNQAALQTAEGLPLQLGNTGKVDGYTLIKNNVGCHNKWSIQANQSGVFFIDDYNKTANIYTSEGIQNVGLKAGFSQWFKDNISGDQWTPNKFNAFRVSTDEITKDLYLINKYKCLVFNYNLGKFTSFMDYEMSPLIVNINLDSLIFNLDNNKNTKVHQMFKGNYNELLDKWCNYGITYRLNPSPYTDNLFTNFSYVADINDGEKADEQFYHMNIPPSPPSSKAHYTFTKVKAWNEYQKGELDLTNVKNRHRHAKDRYRIWHGDIPRDGDTLTSHINAGDRMRNPWLFLELTKENNANDNEKMMFHNLLVTYYS